ncbi:hypothetical protein [Dongia sp.]|uniref:hypothetical protein n=1 Tax=Dongia sp. TaxID=1977262 RepID=UPI003750EC02
MCIRRKLCLLVLLASFAGAAKSAYAYDPDVALARERKLLDTFPAIGERQKQKLVVRFRSGGQRVFEDNRSGCEINDYDNCTRYFARDFDPQRQVLLVEKFQHEWIQYELIDINSGSTITLKTLPEAAPDRRAWAIVDNGIGPTSGEGTGDILMIDQIDGSFRIVGQIHRPMCKFDRWSNNPAFFLICASYSRSPLEGEFYVAPGPNGTLEIMLTPRRVAETEYQSIGSE